jgi:hypothetical protein
MANLLGWADHFPLDAAKLMSSAVGKTDGRWLLAD